MQSITTCDNFQNIYFREYLLLTAFIRFRSTSFSEHLKVAAAFFIKQPCNFFLEKFLFKESSKRARSFILTSMMKENSSIVFHHVFLITFHADTLQNLSLLMKLKNFDFFNPIPGGGVIFTSPIYFGKYSTNSPQNWPGSNSWLWNNFSALTSWITLLLSAKNSNFFNIYSISIAVTNIILQVIWHLEHGGIIPFYI